MGARRSSGEWGQRAGTAQPGPGPCGKTMLTLPAHASSFQRGFPSRPRWPRPSLQQGQPPAEMSPDWGTTIPFPVAAAIGHRRRVSLRPTGHTSSVKRLTLSPIESLFWPMTQKILLSFGSKKGREEEKKQVKAKGPRLKPGPGHPAPVPRRPALITDEKELEHAQQRVNGT